MSVILRSGQFGSYYGSPQGSSSPCTNAQMEVNARYIYNYLSSKGWTLNSISATLGNMTRESSLNPGRWQSDSVGSTSLGYGLVQWTPASKYIDWCSGDYSTMDSNLSRIIYELENNEQYYPTNEYPETFKEYTQSTKDMTYLTTAFLKNYERAGVEALSERIEWSNKWYNYLSGEVPPTPPSPSTSGKRKKYNFLLFNARKRMMRL